MRLHELQPTYKKRSKRRVGRGGKRGTYSGRGMKGQRARAGAKIRPALRDLIKSIPKLRGVRSRIGGTKRGITALNTGRLQEVFSDGAIVSPRTLLERRIIRRAKGKLPVVKILGDGTITKKLQVQGCFVSKGAKEKIEKAGGVIAVQNTAVKTQK